MKFISIHFSSLSFTKASWSVGQNSKMSEVTTPKIIVTDSESAIRDVTVSKYIQCGPSMASRKIKRDMNYPKQ